MGNNQETPSRISIVDYLAQLDIEQQNIIIDEAKSIRSEKSLEFNLPKISKWVDSTFDTVIDTMRSIENGNYTVSFFTGYNSLEADINFGDADQFFTFINRIRNTAVHAKNNFRELFEKDFETEGSFYNRTLAPVWFSSHISRVQGNTIKDMVSLIDEYSIFHSSFPGMRLEISRKDRDSND